jgi:hypothetical protein
MAQFQDMLQGGQQQPQQQAPVNGGFGSSWWHYLAPFIGALGSYGGQGEKGTQGQNIWDSIFGTNPSIEQFGGLDELLKMGLNQFQNPTQGFEPIKQDAERFFKENLVPYIQGQFQSKGGGTGSSHFSSGSLQKNTYGGAASLASKLSAAQAQYGQNQQKNAIAAIQTSKPQYMSSAGGQGLAQGSMELGKTLLPYLI